MGLFLGLKVLVEELASLDKDVRMRSTPFSQVVAVTEKRSEGAEQYPDDPELVGSDRNVEEEDEDEDVGSDTGSPIPTSDSSSGDSYQAYMEEDEIFAAIEALSPEEAEAEEKEEGEVDVITVE
jgi:hypothetical protein